MWAGIKPIPQKKTGYKIFQIPHFFHLQKYFKDLAADKMSNEYNKTSDLEHEIYENKLKLIIFILCIGTLVQCIMSCFINIINWKIVQIKIGSKLKNNLFFIMPLSNKEIEVFCNNYQNSICLNNIAV